MAREIMDYEKCKKEFIRKVEIDSDKAYVSKNKSEFKHIIELLEKLIKENVPNLGQMG